MTDDADLDNFADSYSGARQRFLAAAEAAGASLTSHSFDHCRGRQGEELAIDVARFGEERTDRVLFATSATHGIEGYCGSAIQTGAMTKEIVTDPPTGCAVVLVHALNPHGFSHFRRVTEDNVDLNRNFIDFTAPLPENSGYRALRDWLLPEQWRGQVKEKADAALEAFIECEGIEAFGDAICSGQYCDPQGLFFGGIEATPSNLAWRRIVADHAEDATHIAHVDFHTGLGRYGDGDVICLAPPDTPGGQRAVELFGKRRVTFLGIPASRVYRFQGFIAAVFKTENSDARLLPLALEFGTIPLRDMIEAVRADNWLYIHGDPHSETAQTIKAQMREAFYPDDPEWRRAVYLQGLDLLERLLAGLADWEETTI